MPSSTVSTATRSASRRSSRSTPKVCYLNDFTKIIGQENVWQRAKSQTTPNRKKSVGGKEEKEKTQVIEEKKPEGMTKEVKKEVPKTPKSQKTPVPVRKVEQKKIMKATPKATPEVIAKKPIPKPSSRKSTTTKKTPKPAEDVLETMDIIEIDPPIPVPVETHLSHPHIPHIPSIKSEPESVEPPEIEVIKVVTRPPLPENFTHVDWMRHHGLHVPESFLDPMARQTQLVPERVPPPPVFTPQHRTFGNYLANEVANRQSQSASNFSGFQENVARPPPAPIHYGPPKFWNWNNGFVCIWLSKKMNPQMYTELFNWLGTEEINGKNLLQIEHSCTPRGVNEADYAIFKTLVKELISNK